MFMSLQATEATLVELDEEQLNVSFNLNKMFFTNILFSDHQRKANCRRARPSR